MFDPEVATNSTIVLLRRGIGAGIKVFELPVSANPPHVYLLVMSVPGSAPEGPFLGDPEADVTLTYQLDACSDVKSGRNSAQWLAGKARSVLVGRQSDGSFQFPLSYPGYANVERRTITDPGRVDVEGTREHPVHVCRVQYELVWTPA